ncbi:MAG: hypothetical protein RMK19_07195 [Bacteroidia bacterium]|nr:hypothetical protein [Bacteroidia bacterium]MDW8015782.1 hypothetical protein [Bacteroidia bacterium]
MGWIWLQVVLFGGWGGHTSQNDLVASDEVWHRFYGAGGCGVRFGGQRRLQPGLFFEMGRFVSQDRRQARLTQTRWNSLGLSLRLRPLKKSLSPIVEGNVFRLTAMPRSSQRQPISGIPASFSVNGVGWGIGFSWRPNPWSEISLLYFRRRPQTTLLEGIDGAARDRIEGFFGQFALLFLPPQPSTSRF